ncbi:MAG TPA: preprotein translocase subunit SecY [Firmicutes bacterium]|jgi:preprotein translocase subunit SecY|nr:preprotein translocase subunit SecY [Bacillota bacterium]HAA33764.1 preprotein translocase subunit SecY [Bacillota bacterium]
MMEAIRNAWKIAELRRRIIFTLLMLVVYRIGAHVPVPGINPEILADFFQEDTLFGFYNVIAGGALSDFTIFAMGIMPYINASIIMHLLTVVIPKFKEWSEEGVEGRKKMAQMVRYATVLLALLQATGMTFSLIQPAVIERSASAYVVIIISLTAGTAFLMWLGELITEKGIGNGISLLIFAGIVAGFPRQTATIIELLRLGEIRLLILVPVALVLLGLIVGIIALEVGRRRITVQYAKRIVGRRMYGGQSTHIPLKVNQAGVIPVIFASAILMFPATIATFVNHPIAQSFAEALSWGSVLNTALYAAFIILFTFFYTAIQFDPMKVAGDIKKYGGFIPGLRPGRSTAEYLSKVSSRLTFVGAFSLAFICILPIFMQNVSRINLIFGGTSLIIIVGVALETMRQVESHMLMRNYQGFMK